jgi:hypothetical protein
MSQQGKSDTENHLFNPLNIELNPICHLLALRGGATIVVVTGKGLKSPVNV